MSTSRIISVAVLIQSLASSVPCVGDGDADEIVAALHDGHQQWLEQVEFRATYELRIGSARQTDAPFHAPHHELPQDVQKRATGMFYKLGDMRRVSIEYGEAARVAGTIVSTGAFLSAPTASNQKNGDLVADPGEKLIVTDTPWDAVFNSQRLLTYRPRWKDLFDQAVYELRDQASRLKGGGCAEPERMLSPLNPLRGCNRELFSGAAAMQTVKNHEVSGRDGDYLTVVTTVERTMESGRRIRQTTTVRWWMVPAPPVVERIHRRTEFLDQQLAPFDEYTQLSDFVPTTGGTVPRRVVNTHGPEGQPAECQVWESHDLGNEAPAPEDFIITIPPTTRVMGLSERPPVGQIRHLSLDETALSNFQKLGSLVESGPSGPQEAGAGDHDWRIPLLLANIALVCLFLCLFLWRQRHAS